MAIRARMTTRHAPRRHCAEGEPLRGRKPRIFSDAFSLAPPFYTRAPRWPPSTRRACSGRVAAWSGLGWGVRYARPALLKGREKENVEPLLLRNKRLLPPSPRAGALCVLGAGGQRERGVRLGGGWAAFRPARGAYIPAGFYHTFLIRHFSRRDLMRDGNRVCMQHRRDLGWPGEGNVI